MNWLDFQTVKFERKVKELKELEITAFFNRHRKVC